MLHLSANQWIVARLVYGMLASCAFAGVCSNLALALVIYRTPSLRSSCHIMIGLCALLDGIHQFGPLIQFQVLFGDGEIDNFTCSMLQLLPEMTLFGECACVLSIGIERMTAVMCIARYKKICRKTYLAVYFTWIIVFSFFPAYLMIAYFEPGRHICSVPAPFHGDAGEKWVRALTAVNSTTAVTYCIVAVAISKRAGVSPAMRQAFRCVFIVMVFDVGGWALCNGFLTIAFALDVTAETQFILLWVAGIFVNFGLAAKAWIYYTVSTEYRSAFKSLFYRIVGKTMITRSTATVTESTRYMF